MRNLGLPWRAGSLSSYTLRSHSQVVGCAFCAACEYMLGLRSLAVPIGLLVIAMALGILANLQHPTS